MRKPASVTRTIWCIACNAEQGGSPQDHEITYQGTEYKDGKIMAKFDATCKRCLARDESTQKVHHLIPIASYNALIARPDIYAGNTAP